MPKYPLLVVGASLILLSACQQETAPSTTKTLDAKQITKLIPKRASNPDSWADDIHHIFGELGIHQDAQNACTAIAVIDQESSFNANPVVPNLGEASLKAIDDRLEDKLGKSLAGVFRNMLQTKPTPNNNFIKQIKQVKTEKELDELYQKIFDYFTTSYKVSGLTNMVKLTGEGLDERINPITTLGSMQVHIGYARANRRANMTDRALRNDMYGQYGGLYYGIHRLMMYKADYDDPIYRFADYNSGMYSSRNSAFQQRVATLTGKKLSIDGDLLLYSKGSVSSAKSQTEQALLDLLATGKTPMSEWQIRSDLRKEKSQSFEKTQTYLTINEMFTKKTGKKASYAIMPQVVITGPKLSQDYNTNWFATNVNKRYTACMTTAKKLGYTK